MIDKKVYMINYNKIAEQYLNTFPDSIKKYIYENIELFYDESRDKFLDNVRFFTELATYNYLRLVSNYLVSEALTGTALKVGAAYAGYRVAKAGVQSALQARKQQQLEKKEQELEKRQKELELKQKEQELKQRQRQLKLQRIPIVGKRLAR